MKKKVAVTGGIGSGKSTVIAYLQKKGYAVFSCDEINRELLLEEGYVRKIQEYFPSCIAEGQVDKKALAALVFSSEKNLAILNEISHPLIMQKLNAKMDECTSELCFAEVPLLFEGGFEYQFNRVIVVLRSEEERISSLLLRDCVNEEQIRNRIKTQFSYDSEEGLVRMKNCNAILLYNDGARKNLEAQIDRALAKL